MVSYIGAFAIIGNKYPWNGIFPTGKIVVHTTDGNELWIPPTYEQAENYEELRKKLYAMVDDSINAAKAEVETNEK